MRSPSISAAVAASVLSGLAIVETVLSGAQTAPSTGVASPKSASSPVIQWLPSPAQGSLKGIVPPNFLSPPALPQWYANPLAAPKAGPTTPPNLWLYSPTPLPLPNAGGKLQSRNLLLTPEDRAQTQTIHPLLTPETKVQYELLPYPPIILNADAAATLYENSILNPKLLVPARPETAPLKLVLPRPATPPR